MSCCPVSSRDKLSHPNPVNSNLWIVERPNGSKRRTENALLKAVRRISRSGKSSLVCFWAKITRKISFLSEIFYHFFISKDNTWFSVKVGLFNSFVCEKCRSEVCVSTLEKTLCLLHSPETCFILQSAGTAVCFRSLLLLNTHWRVVYFRQTAAM